MLKSNNFGLTSTLEAIIRKGPEIFRQIQKRDEDGEDISETLESGTSSVNEFGSGSGGNSEMVCPSGMLV